MRHRARLVTAALACTLALDGCGDQSSRDPAAEDRSGSDDDAASATDRTSPGTAIPDDFPLSSGMGGPDGTVLTSRTGTGLRDLELCGTSPLRGLGTRDRMVSDDSGGESADTRELLVLGAPEDASRLADRLAGLVADCAETDTRRDMETRTEVLASPFGPGPAATLLQTYTVDGEPGTGATVVHVVPVGAALLVTSTYGRWTRERAREAVDATVGPLRETVAALGMFGEAPTSAPVPSGSPPSPTSSPTASPSASPSSTPSSTIRFVEPTQPSKPPEPPAPLEPADISALRVTRVGSARPMVTTYGEGTLASLDRQADEVTGTTNQIVRTMCAYTRTGC